MVLRQFDCDGVLRENSARVTCIGADDLGLCDQDDSSGATCETFCVLRERVLLELGKLLFALFGIHKFVHLEETLFESLLVALALVARKLHQFLSEVFLHI